MWAARTIQRWWKVENAKLKHDAYLRWLPIDIDPENCNFSDVDRVLKVLDDYALQKMAILHKQPKLPQAVLIQRFVRTYLRTTRV